LWSWYHPWSACLYIDKWVMIIHENSCWTIIVSFLISNLISEI
jgi:hypothetical protein